MSKNGYWLFALLMMGLWMPILSYAKCDTVIECYQQAIQDLQHARAEIDKLRQQAAEDAKQIEKFRQSAKQKDEQIDTLFTQLNTTAEQVAKLTEAVRVSEDGNVGIGTTNPEAKLHVNGNILGAARDVSGTAQRICSGKTEMGKTAWVQHRTDGVYVDIDTSGCQFSSTPIYISSVGGKGWHWETTGGSSIYSSTKNSFRIYLKLGAITPAKANEYGWHINWMAIGH
jgi:hypothetical protein